MERQEAPEARGRSWGSREKREGCSSCRARRRHGLCEAGAQREEAEVEAEEVVELEDGEEEAPASRVQTQEEGGGDRPGPGERQTGLN